MKDMNFKLRKMHVMIFLICTLLPKIADTKCSEDATNVENPIIWPSSPNSDTKIVSNPLCLTENQELVTRVCSKSKWVPKHDDVPDCHVTQSRPSSFTCPPDFTSIEMDDSKFCYNLSSAQSWDYPCFKSASMNTILDLSKLERDVLLNKLEFSDRKLVWLPASRIVPYGPIVWNIVGDLWGEPVEFEDIKFNHLPAAQNCLLLDLENFKVKTENCTYKYPALCIFKHDHILPLHCPAKYGTARYDLNDGRCYGLEIKEEGATWDEFVKTSCKQPIQISQHLDNYLFETIASYHPHNISNLCWTALARENNLFYWHPNLNLTYLYWDSQTDFTQRNNLRGAINEKFKWTLLDKERKLSCMACQVKPGRKEVDLILYYSTEFDSLFLTIYNPSYLWKEQIDDPGVQCFTNAKGFVEIAEIEGEPHSKLRFSLKDLILEQIDKIIQKSEVEKSVYKIEYSKKESGEYWCEGHASVDFKLVNSSKVLVPMKTAGHRFALRLELKQICEDETTCDPHWKEIAESVSEILDLEEVYVMEVEKIENSNAVVLFHVIVDLLVDMKCSSINCAIHRTFQNLTSMCAEFASGSSFKFLSLKSTMYCLPDEGINSTSLHWELTQIGDNVSPKEFCMQSNGLPVIRRCGGSFIHGGQWEDTVGECSSNYEPTNRTTFLYALAKGKADQSTTSTFLSHDVIELLNDKDDLIPADIYFLSLSFKKIVEMSDENSSLIELGDTNNLANVIDSIMNVEARCLNLAQSMNSSNVLLDNLDVILSKIANNESDVIIDMEKGVDIAVTPLFALQISNPSISNVTGLALARKINSASNSFTEMNIIPLTPNMTVDDIIKIPGLEIASWLPQDLLDRFLYENSTNNKSLNIIIDIFNNDIIFQETKTVRTIVNSRVISVTIPGRETELPLPLPIIFKRLNTTHGRKECAYWDFSEKQGTYGAWSKKGCYFVASYDDLDVCACFHLTHFAQLVLGFKGGSENSAEILIYQYHGRALNAITMVGCSLSLVGIAGIVATAVIFKTWRQKPGTKVLLQLSAAITMQSMMMVVQDSAYENDVQCIIKGAFLHYTVLAAFMWMLLSAVLQFTRYVKVLGAQRPARFMIKFSLVGWGLPVIPVFILLLVNSESYLPPIISSKMSRDPSALCYPQGLGLYFSVLVPVAIIVGTNLTVFILVMRSISLGPDGKSRMNDPEIVMSQLRLSVLLFFLLGLSWIFGLMAVAGGSIIFSYLFCLTATLQGFILFLYFVICDPSTRVLWVSLVKEKSKLSVKAISS